MLAFAPEEAKETGEGEHELLFKIINFAILAAGLTFLLRKPLSAFFAERSASIRRSLEEGRKAREASQARLSAVQEKLQRLEEEIQAFRASAMKEMEAERERLRQSTAEEGKKILEAARAQVDTSTQAAKLELRVYAAEEALKLAERMIRERLDEPARRRLVNQFLASLEARETRN